MSIATRTADPTGPDALSAVTGAVAVDSLPSRPHTPEVSPSAAVVVIDLPRVAQRFRALQAALPWMDVAYDVCALAHPALVSLLAEDGAGFVVSHGSGLAALERAGADPARVLHAPLFAHRPERRTAWEAGVRRFVVEDARDLDDFTAAPAGTSVFLRLNGYAAVEAAVRAQSLGVAVAGLSLRPPLGYGSREVLDAVQDAVRTGRRIASATGRRLPALDLGDAFASLSTRPEHAAQLGRSIRALVAPATSHIRISASAGRAVAADAITIVTGTAERFADAATASEYIDAGAEVLVLRRPRRILRPSRTRTTWSPVG
ncbi:hypothetical protein [Leifsonia sp. LS-T14]|uniref:hypothetical protein n=1 Tax=unclassified Leifsonia TaxID=2663824 RepID=UPI0035A66B73